MDPRTKKKRKKERAGRRTEEVSEAVAYRYLYCIFMDRFWRTAITVSSQNAWRVIIMRQTSKLSLILNHIKHVCIYIYHIIIRLNLNYALIWFDKKPARLCQKLSFRTRCAKFFFADVWQMLFTCLSFLSSFFSLYRCLSVSLCLSIYLSIHLSIHLSIYLSN